MNIDVPQTLARSLHMLVVLFAVCMMPQMPPASADIPAAVAYSPVEILHCHLYPRRNAYEIAFRNRTQVIADEISFAVKSREGVLQVEDRGTFSPAISIYHFYRPKPIHGFYLKSIKSCTVQAAHFVDGTKWASSDEGSH